MPFPLCDGAGIVQFIQGRTTASTSPLHVSFSCLPLPFEIDIKSSLRFMLANSGAR